MCSRPPYSLVPALTAVLTAVGLVLARVLRCTTHTPRPEPETLAARAVATGPAGGSGASIGH